MERAKSTVREMRPEKKRKWRGGGKRKWNFSMGIRKKKGENKIELVSKERGIGIGGDAKKKAEG